MSYFIYEFIVKINGEFRSEGQVWPVDITPDYVPFR